MKKYLKYVIIIIVMLLSLFLISKYFQPSIDEEIEKTLLDKGFQKSSYENLFEKQETETKTLLFSIADYTYMLNNEETTNGVNYSINATYYYKQENIVYSYRVTYNNSYNVYFKGEYSKDNFTCEKEFSNAKLSNDEKETICNLAKTNLDIFYLESKVLFANNKIIKYIKQQ